jgi:2-polyprenyl-3-methyl-5-hydroxy-6-metoxy-1,4-benzoquinol methylase
MGQSARRRSGQVSAVDLAVEARARLSLGRGHDRIHRTVAALLEQRGAAGTLVDAGCGTGDLWRATRGRFSQCIGLDAVRYPQLPDEVVFRQADLDGTFPVDAASADATAAVEVIEHLENPRAFMRELVRVTKPGGWVVVTTPNQLSALSLLTLIVKGRFSAFQEGDYPAHRTALLEIDLRRIAVECGLDRIDIAFTQWGRLPLSGRHYPEAIAALSPRRFSDNVAMIGRRCA